jgi:hypothetical protein
MKISNGLAIANHKPRIAATTARARIILSIITAIVLTGGVLAGLNAGPADAATARATIDTTYANITYYSGATEDYPCEEGSTFHSGLPNEVKDVFDHCEVRVWLHSSNENTGPSLCFSPGEYADTSPYETVTWVNFYVSDNSSPC